MRLYLPAVLLIAAAMPALAQDTPRERPDALNRVVNCRSIQSAEERLACYDREVAAFDTAESTNQVVVMDRQQVRRTRRTLFGLVLPDLGVFGDNNTDPEEAVAQIETTIRSASMNALGKWVITLEDGARWIQSDSRNLGRYPGAGMPIRIRRAAMGSYLANVDGQIAIRVRRER